MIIHAYVYLLMLHHNTEFASSCTGRPFVHRQKVSSFRPDSVQSLERSMDKEWTTVGPQHQIFVIISFCQCLLRSKRKN